jgi:hypothetical protein
MTATITDLDAYRARRAAQTPARPHALPDPWGSPTESRAEPRTGLDEQTGADATAPPPAPDGEVDPYTVTGHIERRRRLAECVGGFADQYRHGFGASVEDAMRSILKIETAFALALPSLSGERIHRAACDTARQVVAHVDRGGATEPLVDRVVADLMVKDRRASRGTRSRR